MHIIFKFGQPINTIGIRMKGTQLVKCTPNANLMVHKLHKNKILRLLINKVYFNQTDEI
jgi:hypothetical protein